MSDRTAITRPTIDIDLNQVRIPLSWTELFGREVPVEVEIGCGKGRFLNLAAQQHPERDFLAIERAGKYHTLCCERAARRGLTNVRLLRTTAEDLLVRLLEPASVTTFYVLFPDPWPKKRHHKRRFFTTASVAALSAALVPGGRLLVKSDHPGYSEVIAEVLAAAPALEPLTPESEFEDLPLTGFEVKYLDQGRSIQSFACRKS